MVIQKYKEASGTITSTRYEWETSSSKTWGFDYIELDGERYRFESLDLGTWSREIGRLTGKDSRNRQKRCCFCRFFCLKRPCSPSIRILPLY